MVGFPSKLSLFYLKCNLRRRSNNPAPPPTPSRWVRPYRIRLTKFSDAKKYDLAFPWVSELEITIKEHTQVRYALAAYAHRRDPGLIDDPSRPVTFRVSTYFPITENVIFSRKYTQFYEGTATVAGEDGANLGTAWVEHMANLDSKSLEKDLLEKASVSAIAPQEPASTGLGCSLM